MAVTPVCTEGKQALSEKGGCLSYRNPTSCSVAVHTTGSKAAAILRWLDWQQQ